MKRRALADLTPPLNGADGIGSHGRALTVEASDGLVLVVWYLLEQQSRPNDTDERSVGMAHLLRTVAALGGVDCRLRACVEEEWRGLVFRWGASPGGWLPLEAATGGAGPFETRLVPMGSIGEGYSAIGKRCIGCRIQLPLPPLPAAGIFTAGSTFQTVDVPMGVRWADLAAPVPATAARPAFCMCARCAHLSIVGSPHGLVSARDKRIAGVAVTLGVVKGRSQGTPTFHSQVARYLWKEQPHSPSSQQLALACAPALRPLRLDLERERIERVLTEASIVEDLLECGRDVSAAEVLATAWPGVAGWAKQEALGYCAAPYRPVKMPKWATVRSRAMTQLCDMVTSGMPLGTLNAQMASEVGVGVDALAVLRLAMERDLPAPARLRTVLDSPIGRPVAHRVRICHAEGRSNGVALLVDLEVSVPTGGTRRFDVEFVGIGPFGAKMQQLGEMFTPTPRKRRTPSAAFMRGQKASELAAELALSNDWGDRVHIGSGGSGVSVADATVRDVLAASRLKTPFHELLCFCYSGDHGHKAVKKGALARLPGRCLVDWPVTPRGVRGAASAGC